MVQEHITEGGRQFLASLEASLPIVAPPVHDMTKQRSPAPPTLRLVVNTISSRLMAGKKDPRDDRPNPGYLEVRCLGCDTHQTVALGIVRRPKATPIHELERYMRCKDCSQVRGYAYKRSHLVALRPTKISALDPPSTWWPGER
jgi:hypothetical protein